MNAARIAEDLRRLAADAQLNLSTEALRTLDRAADALDTAARQATLARDLAVARHALESITLAGMSGTGQETEEGLRAWHARRAWSFISTAARALADIDKPKEQG